MEEGLKPTKDQIEFAKGMSKRQANTLRALAYAGPFVLSASERGDAEMYALVRMKLAQGWRMHAGGIDLFTWDATPAGRALADQFLEPALMLAPGPSRPSARCGA